MRYTVKKPFRTRATAGAYVEFAVGPSALLDVSADTIETVLKPQGFVEENTASVVPTLEPAEPEVPKRGKR